jgi:uncharacterized protein (TIGR03435 family)
MKWGSLSRLRTRFPAGPSAAGRVVCLLVCATACRAAGFESAFVYPSPASPNSNLRGGFLRGNQYEVHNATLAYLIATAYSIDPDRLIGGPAWLDTALFDVIAPTAPDALKTTLQALLADRFQLIVHDATKPFPQHVLIAGPRLQLTKSAGSGEASCQSNNSPGPPPVNALTCRNMSISDFAARLPRIAGDYLQNNPVFDQTNLAGLYDFTVQWTPRNWLASARDDGTPLAVALEKQLGLTLEIKPVPVPVVVIDQVQQPAPDPATPQNFPAFEVATIKPSAPTTIARSFRMDAGQVDLRGFTLRELIKYAWGMQDLDVIDNDDLLSATPKSAGSQRYDILAKTPGPRLDIATMLVMLRSLLADRFSLTTHYEERPVSVYALIPNKPKLARPADLTRRSSCRLPPVEIVSPAAPIFSVACRNTTMSQLAAQLQGMGALYISHPVIDATGLKGPRDFTMSWSPPHLVKTGESDPNPSVTLVEALDKQLGLKLKLQKHPMPVLVVDHVEPKPSEN